MRNETHLRLDPQKLLHQLQLRGASARAVVLATGISPTTLSGVLQHGKLVTPRTARRLAKWLAETAPLEALAELMPDRRRDFS